MSRALANAPLLRRVPFFKDVDDGATSEMAQLLTPHLFVPEEVVIAVGTIGAEVYIIKNGTLKVAIRCGVDGSEMRDVALLTSNDFFGEGALLKGERASAIASERDDETHPAAVAAASSSSSSST